MSNLSILANLSSLSNQNKAHLIIVCGFLLIISIPIIGIIRDNIKSKKKAKKEKDTSLWDYEFYKEKSYLLGSASSSLISNLSKSNLSENEIKKTIDEFNSIDSSFLKVTYDMVGYEKRKAKEETPQRLIDEKRRAIASKIWDLNYENSKNKVS